MIASILRRILSLGAPPADVAAAGQAALIEAEQLWQQDIHDPRRDDQSADGDRCRAFIDCTIRSDDGLGWGWDTPYEGNGFGREWCGAFAARCLRHHVPLAVRRTFFASTTRLLCWGEGRPWERVRSPLPPGRFCVPFNERTRTLPAGVTPQAGDILLVGGVPGGRRKREGQHITIVQSYSDGIFSVYEGNAHSIGPRGDRREGVGRGKYPLGLRADQLPGTYHALWLIRPAASDLS